MLETAAGSPQDLIRRTAVECGYIIMHETTVPEYRLDLCKGYTPQGFDKKVFHLHIRYSGDWDEIVFCEYLKQNPDKAQEYAALKYDLQDNTKVYSYNKSIFYISYIFNILIMKDDEKVLYFELLYVDTKLENKTNKLQTNSFN